MARRKPVDHERSLRTTTTRKHSERKEFVHLLTPECDLCCSLVLFIERTREEFFGREKLDPEGKGAGGEYNLALSY